jgi:hypothetical protein
LKHSNINLISFYRTKNERTLDKIGSILAPKTHTLSDLPIRRTFRIIGNYKGWNGTEIYALLCDRAIAHDTPTTPYTPLGYRKRTKSKG